MKSRIILLSLSFILFLLTSCEKKEHNTLTKSEISEGWNLLFDGKTLNGWKEYKDGVSSGFWEVVDGCIQAKSHTQKKGDFLVTVKTYENFELLWDWKLSKAGNSGLLYHIKQRPQYDAPPLTGPEYQLIDETAEKFKGKLKWNCLGADYSMYIPDSLKKRVNPPGKWNNSKLVFDNGHVEHWINGEKILEFEAWSDNWFKRKSMSKWAKMAEYGLFKDGLIGLQNHGDPISFRNIKIKELPRKSKKQELFSGSDLKMWQAVTTKRWNIKNHSICVANTVKEQFVYLLSREYYDDFEMTAEIKTANFDLGILGRTYFNNKFLEGCMLRISSAKNESGLFILNNNGLLQKKIYHLKNIESDFKDNEWNVIKLRIQRDRVKAWINDVEIIDFENQLLTTFKGAVGLIDFSPSTNTLWRNISIMTL